MSDNVQPSFTAEMLPDKEAITRWAHERAIKNMSVGWQADAYCCPLAQCFNELLGGSWSVHEEMVFCTSTRGERYHFPLPSFYQRIVRLVDDLPQEYDDETEKMDISPKEFIAILNEV